MGYKSIRARRERELTTKESKEEVKEPKKCIETTKAGNPCKNVAMDGSKYCPSHQKEE